jgi:hypothetical protein
MEAPQERYQKGRLRRRRRKRLLRVLLQPYRGRLFVRSFLYRAVFDPLETPSVANKSVVAAVE